MPRTAFLSTGFHVPARLVTNDDLAKVMDTSDEWIVQRSGIKTRYWVDKGETGVGLARDASKKALDKAGLAAALLNALAPQVSESTLAMEIFDYDNVLLLPRKCRVDSRAECDTTMEFGGPHTAALWNGSAIAVQFHPERSGKSGLQLLENFLDWDGVSRIAA